MKKMLTLTLSLTMLLTQAVGAETNDYFGFDSGVESITLSHNVFTYHPYSRTYYDYEKEVEKDWNEDNNVTGVRFNTSDNFGIGFAYGKNSYYKNMFIIEADFRFDTTNKNVSYGASLLLATGYEDRFQKLQNTGGLMPAVFTYAQLSYKDFHLKTGMLNMAAFSLMIEYDINLN